MANQVTHHRDLNSLEEEAAQLEMAMEARTAELQFLSNRMEAEAERQERFLNVSQQVNSTKPTNLRQIDMYDRATMERAWEARFGTKILREGSKQEFERWWTWLKGEDSNSNHENDEKIDNNREPIRGQSKRKVSISKEPPRATKIRKVMN